MKNIVKGKFQVKGTPEPSDPTVQAIGAMRMRFDKRFEGALDAEGTVAMTGIMDRDIGSGGYVALERIAGSLDGKKGSFCLQHNCLMSKGAQTQDIRVVPDTGTAELKGLTGTMRIEIADGGQHFYVFEYELG
ncbi:MAG TPA: DUF3224 domain-containing protein [Fibrobacteria bacterium]|nr:DUF3224 domain-containing protein [Fibrobacteria bacterium]